MTTTYGKTFTCNNCGNRFEGRTLSSTNMMGSPDLDTRPPKMQRFTMDTWLQECPNCKYVLQNEGEKVSSEMKELIRSERYQTCDGRKFKNTLAERFYRNSLILEENEDYEDAMLSALQAAWLCDDAEDRKNADWCRGRFLENYEKLSMLERNLDLKLMRIDVLRRMGEFERVLEECDPSAFDQPIMNGIAMFHIRLAKDKDDKCYRIEDALK